MPRDLSSTAQSKGVQYITAIKRCSSARLQPGTTDSAADIRRPIRIIRWHNLQYILFVWLYNNRRFNGSLDPEQRFLSCISQNGRFPVYFVTCFAISTALYLLISLFLANAIGAAFAITATMAGLIIYQTLNFHHYVVDSVIWKLRRPKIQRTLGLN